MTIESGTRVWSARDRAHALDAALTESGFGQSNGDWTLRSGELQWHVFLGVVSDGDGERHDVAFSAQLVGERDEWAYLINQSLSELPAASRREYRDRDVAVADPLIVDTRAILLPLVRRLRTSASVLDAWLAGELGLAYWDRANQIARAWKLATEYGYPEHAALAESVAAVGQWSPEDRWHLQSGGMPVEGPVREPRPASWLSRLARRSR